MDKIIVPTKSIRLKEIQSAAEDGRTFFISHRNEISANEYLNYSLFRLVPPHQMNPGTIVVRTVPQPSILEEHNYHKRPTIKTIVRKKLYWLRPPCPSDDVQQQKGQNDRRPPSLPSSSMEAPANDKLREATAPEAQGPSARKNCTIAQNVFGDCANAYAVAQPTDASPTADNNDSYLDDQGIRWHRLFVLPHSDLSNVRRICIEFGGGSAGHCSADNKSVVFRCAFGGECPFRLIYVPERHTVYGQIEHKHSYLFVQAINKDEDNTNASRDEKEEERIEKEMSIENENSDGQRKNGVHQKDAREKETIDKVQKTGKEKEAKEELIENEEEESREQREEVREKETEDGKQQNGEEKEAKEEVIVNGGEGSREQREECKEKVINDRERQNREAPVKEMELNGTAAAKRTIIADHRLQFNSRQFEENSVAVSRSVPRSFSDHFVATRCHWLANVREEEELKQFCTQNYLKFPVALNWAKLIASRNAFVRLRCNFRHTHQTTADGGGDLFVNRPCNYYAIFVPSRGAAIFHKSPHIHPPREKAAKTAAKIVAEAPEDGQRPDNGRCSAKLFDQQQSTDNFDRLLNWWLPGGWLVFAQLDKLSDFVGICLRHTLRYVHPNYRHHSGNFRHALSSSPVPAMPPPPSSIENNSSHGDYIAYLQCVFNNGEDNSGSHKQKTVPIQCPFRALFSRRRKTVYCSVERHNHQLPYIEEAYKYFTPLNERTMSMIEPRSEFDGTPCHSVKQAPAISVTTARPFPKKNWRLRHADACALRCARMSHKRAVVAVSERAFERMMRKAARKNFRRTKKQTKMI